MPRILAIDYGGKRVGIAATDKLQLIANGLDTVDTKELFNFLKKYFEQEEVECVVIGEPKRLDLSATHSTEMTEKFVREFKQKYPGIAVERMDERFTSKLAVQAMLAGGLKKKDRQKKEIIDKVSATIILQSFLEQKKFSNERNKK